MKGLATIMVVIIVGVVVAGAVGAYHFVNYDTTTSEPIPMALAPPKNYPKVTGCTPANFSEWHIQSSDDCTFTGEVSISGGVVIDGNLTLDGAKLIINSTADSATSNITVNTGGQLNVINQANITNNDTAGDSYNYMFAIYNDPIQVHINDSYIRKAGWENVNYHRGIDFQMDGSSENIMISNNTIDSDYVGIYWNDVDDSMILDNTITSNYVGLWVQTGNYRINITGNNVTNNAGAYALYLYNNNYGNISYNDFTSSSSYGVHFHTLYTSNITDNNFTGDVRAVYLQSSTNNLFQRNTYDNYDATNTYGMYLYNSDGNHFCTENITTNYWGYRMDFDSDNNRFCNSTITSSGSYGVYISDDNSDGNVFNFNHITAASDAIRILEDNNNFTNNDISASGGANSGIFLVDSNVENTYMINNTITADGYGVRAYGDTYNNYVINSTITGTNADIYLNDDGHTSNLTIQNSSLSNDYISFIDITDKTEVFVWYYLNTQVNDTATGLGISTVTVTVDDVSSLEIGNQNTDANGRTEYNLTRAFMQNGTATYEDTPHTIEGSKAGYDTNSTTWNLTLYKTSTVPLWLSVPAGATQCYYQGGAGANITTGITVAYGDTLICNDTLAEVDGNILVYGNILFDNFTTEFQIDSDGEHNLTVFGGGGLEVGNQTTFTSNNSLYQYNFISFADSTEIRDSNFTRCGWNGGELDYGLFIGNDSSQIISNTFEGNAGRSIYLNDSSYHLIEDNVVEGYNDAIYLNYINSSFIYNNTVFSDNGISDSIAGTYVYNTSIYDNDVLYSIDSGIKFGSSDVDIYDNTIRNCGEAGISIDASYAGNVYNNLIEYSDWGIQLTESDGLTVYDNTYRYANWSCLYAYGLNSSYLYGNTYEYCNMIDYMGNECGGDPGAYCGGLTITEDSHNNVFYDETVQHITGIGININKTYLDDLDSMISNNTFIDVTITNSSVWDIQFNFTNITAYNMVFDDTTASFSGRDARLKKLTTTEPAAPTGMIKRAGLLNITNSSTIGSLLLNMSYSTFTDETNLTMYKYNTTWYSVDGQTLDTTNDYISVQLDDFSLFGIFESLVIDEDVAGAIIYSIIIYAFTLIYLFFYSEGDDIFDKALKALFISLFAIVVIIEMFLMMDLTNLTATYGTLSPIFEDYMITFIVLFTFLMLLMFIYLIYTAIKLYFPKKRSFRDGT